MLFLPVIIVFIVSRRVWVKVVAALIWGAGMFITPDYIIHYLIATAIFYPIIYLIVRYFRNRKSND